MRVRWREEEEEKRRRRRETFERAGEGAGLCMPDRAREGENLRVRATGPAVTNACEAGRSFLHLTESVVDESASLPNRVISTSRDVGKSGALGGEWQAKKAHNSTTMGSLPWCYRALAPQNFSLRAGHWACLSQLNISQRAVFCESATKLAPVPGNTAAKKVRPCRSDDRRRRQERRSYWGSAVQAAKRQQSWW